MTARYGRGPVMLVSTAVMLLGLLLTLFSSLWLIFTGMLLFSAGFFAAHSVASSWIGPRARRAKGGHPLCICLAIILAPASPGRWAVCSGTTTAGTAWAGLSR